MEQATLNFVFRTKNNLLVLSLFQFINVKFLKKIGLYDEELIRNQDDELNYRCIANGFKILMSPALTTNYLVRENAIDLSKQYYLYGFYKPFVFKKVKNSFKIYHYVPAFHLFLIIPIANYFPLINYTIYYISCYLLFSLILSFRNSKSFKGTAYSVFIFATIHYSYGLGFFNGYLKRMYRSYFPKKNKKNDYGG